jgi:HEAT repeat protein
MAIFGPPDPAKLEASGDVSGLIRALGYEKDAGIRAASAKSLGRIGDSRAVEPLIAVLADARREVRRAAVEALSLIGNPRAVESLLRVLKDSDPIVRQTAASAVGKVGAPAVEPLMGALTDTTAGVRQAAARALGTIGDPRAIEPLGGALTDSTAGVRQAAAKALAKLGWTPEPGQPGEAYRLVEKRQWAECVRLGAPAVEPLVAALKRRDKMVRRAAADALGRIADPRAGKALVAALGDPDLHCRRSATEALIKISGGAFKPVAAALVDANPTRRQLARQILDRTGWLPDKSEAAARYWIAKRQWSRCVEIGGRAVRPLIWALASDDDEVRGDAALALGKIGNRRAVAPLCASLKVGDSSLRQVAAEALGEIGDPRAVQPLIAALGDSDVVARQAAAQSLGKMGDQVVRPVIAALGDSNELVRHSAADALRHIGDQAVQPLIAAFGNSNALVRHFAAEALGKMGDPRAVEPLIGVLKDTDRTVRQGAMDALCELGSPAVLPLCAALSGRDDHLRMQAAKVLVLLYESGKLGEEDKAAILGQRGTISEMHADRTGQHTDESSPGEFGHADLTYHHDQHLIFEVREAVAAKGVAAKAVAAKAVAAKES